jgi:hypothetical protein
MSFFIVVFFCYTIFLNYYDAPIDSISSSLITVQWGCNDEWPPKMFVLFCKGCWTDPSLFSRSLIFYSNSRFIFYTYRSLINVAYSVGLLVIWILEIVFFSSSESYA